MSLSLLLNAEPSSSAAANGHSVGTSSYDMNASSLAGPSRSRNKKKRAPRESSASAFLMDDDLEDTRRVSFVRAISSLVRI